MINHLIYRPLSVTNFIEIEEGKYWEILPSIPLRPYIRKYYLTEGFSAFQNVEIHPIGKVNIEMHFHYGKAGFDVFDFYHHDFKERRAYIVGNQPFDKLYHTRIIKEMAMLSIEFTNMGVLCLLHCFPIDLFKKIIDVESLPNERYKDLAKSINKTSTNEGRIMLLEAFFKQMLIPIPDLSENEKDILTYLDTQDCNAVEEISTALNISQRTVGRVFSSRLGLRPKEYLRIKRLDKACEMLSKYPEVSISDIINDCHYFDQSHFIREFSSVVNKSPLQYLKGVNGLFYFGRGYVI